MGCQPLHVWLFSCELCPCANGAFRGNPACGLFEADAFGLNVKSAGQIGFFRFISRVYKIKVLQRVPPQLVSTGFSLKSLTIPFRAYLKVDLDKSKKH
jgi:hypothetical protein